jgi:hypothetical protein
MSPGKKHAVDGHVACSTVRVEGMVMGLCGVDPGSRVHAGLRRRNLLDQSSLKQAWPGKGVEISIRESSRLERIGNAARERGKFGLHH